MAISKEILNNKKKKTNQPEPLGTVPANNPDHVSAPVDFHHPIPPKPVLHNSFNEAVGACEQIFLKPGEAHTEFYQEEGIIHCVVGIGNYNPGYRHLYLTDTGSNMSIDERLADMAEQINILNNTVEVYVEDVSGLKKDVSILNGNITKFENNINRALDQIRSDIETFEGSVSELLENASTQIAELSEQVEDISNYVNGFGERIQQNTDNIADLSTRVVEIENWKPEVDASINRLEDLINGFEPIDTSSIRSLFHDDIYTVNLCCYTAGGHVEIFDDCGGINVPGGTDTRVAECTPFNEYKTYVKGDNVSFLAVPNEGYKFVRWHINGRPDSEELSIDTSFGCIDLSTNVTDIPVIGTLANGIEPGILEYGYTAVFEKLLKLTVSVHCDTNIEDLDPLYFNDRLEIKVNDVSVDYEKAKKGEVYFDKNSKVEITALPDENGSHEFIKFVIRENPASAIVIEDNPYVNNNVETNLIVEAYFMEYWVYVHADVEPTDHGDIICPTGAEKPYIINSSVYMYVDNIDDGWSFDKWVDEEIGDLTPYVTPDVTSSEITLRISKDVESYHLKALLKEGLPTVKYSITYNGNGGGGTVIDEDSPYNEGDEVIVLDNGFTPPPGGKVFTKWNTEADGSGDDYEPEDIFEINDNMVLYAQWEKIMPDTVTASFIDYNGAELYTVEINKGETPSYGGETPTRADDYDPEINRGTEFTFSGWDPEIEAIYEDTTYTAIYSTKQFKYVTTTKYIRDAFDSLSEDKEYILVAPILELTGEIDVAINAEFNDSLKQFNTLDGKVYTDLLFLNLMEFKIDEGTEPTTFIGIEHTELNNRFYLKDLDDNGYLITLDGKSNNKFAAKQYNKELSNIDDHWIWTLNNLTLSIDNIGADPARALEYNYNNGDPRFAPYRYTMPQAHLFYKNVETTKEYIGFLGAIYTGLNIPLVTNILHHIAINEDID